jgi:hypothetical protein
MQSQIFAQSNEAEKSIPMKTAEMQMIQLVKQLDQIRDSRILIGHIAKINPDQERPMILGFEDCPQSSHKEMIRNLKD